MKAPAPMRPGDTIEIDGVEWDVEKTELRGFGDAQKVWALITRSTGQGKKREYTAREWIPVEKEKS